MDGQKKISSINKYLIDLLIDWLLLNVQQAVFQLYPKWEQVQ
jgi:hypothetical protein